MYQKNENMKDKMGVPGKIVRVYETALNYSVKAHKGRALLNKTNALCIVEYDTKISKAYAFVIKDKKAATNSL